MEDTTTADAATVGTTAKGTTAKGEVTSGNGEKININSIPELKDKPGVIPYKVMIDGVEHEADPSIGYYRQIQPDGTTVSDSSISYDTLNVSLLHDSSRLTGIEINGTIAGVELTGRDYIQALKKRNPDAHVSFSEIKDQINNIPTFSIEVKNVNELNITIQEPTIKERWGFTGAILVNAENIENSNFYISSSNVNASFKNIDNSEISTYPKQNDIYNHNITYTNISNCSISNTIMLPSNDTYTCDKSSIIYESGVNNDIYLITNKLHENSFYTKTNISFSNMFASKFLYSTGGTSFSFQETAPNHNSIVDVVYNDVADLAEKSYTNEFQTIDNDKCKLMVSASAPSDSTLTPLENIEIKTGGELVKLDNFLFYSTAINNEVYDLTPSAN
jgi:hypothetical protein